MSRRKKLVIIEIISTILFMISIILIIVNGFKSFGEMLGPGKYILKINNFNRESIEEYLKKSNSYSPKQSIQNANKIQYFLDFNDAEYTIFYNDNSTYKISDDGLLDLMEFIKENGYSLMQKYIILEFFSIIICVVIFEKKKEIGSKIDEMDNERNNNI